jgi:hypothetical protein
MQAEVQVRRVSAVLLAAILADVPDELASVHEVAGLDCRSAAR